MRVRLIQKDIDNHDYKSYLDAVPRATTDIVCLPELATSGCLYNGGEVAPFDDVLRGLSGYDFSVFIGVPRKEGPRLYNSYVYFKDGKHQVYDKINLFPPMNEPRVYTPGATPGVIDTGFGLFGIAICYDLRFPDLFVQLTSLGVRWIIVPAAFPRERISDWRRLLVDRARETGCYVIGVNAVGDDGVNVFGGSSMVCDGAGEVLIEADDRSEEVIDIDL